MEGFRPILAPAPMTAVGWMPTGGRRGGAKTSRALAKATYGLGERNAGRPWTSTSSPTITAAARVDLSLGSYLGLERKVISVGDASSMPATPAISRSVGPSSWQSTRAASSPSFIGHLGTQ